ncbi:MAG: hypothetical protein FWF82_07095 [Oscillospiraceae bacterium]|nr:hypothetical protein [Oscillospiraceae bacterium]
MKKNISVFLATVVLLSACSVNAEPATESPSETSDTATSQTTAVKSETTTVSQSETTTVLQSEVTVISSESATELTEPTSISSIQNTVSVATTSPATQSPTPTLPMYERVPPPPDGSVIVAIDSSWVRSIVIDYRQIEMYGNHYSRKTITSHDSLKEYFENILSLEPLDGVANLKKEKCDELLEVYDDDFFESYVIVTYAYSQRSGARPIIRNLEHNGEEMYITVEKLYANSLHQPALMSSDFCFIKIDRDYYDGRDIGVKAFTKE